MDYGESDSSAGTDDDLPPSHTSRMPRGRGSGNGRAAVQGIQYGRPQSDMETRIHCLEQDAYSAVLRAFKAQSDAITWAKEGLMSELRKELRVSDEEHRELLGKVNADDVLRQIREWRQAGANQSGFMTNVIPAPVSTSSPTVSASQKKQKTAHVMPAIQLPPPPSNLYHSPVPSPSLPFSAAVKKGDSVGVRGRKPKGGQPQTKVPPIVKAAQGPQAAGPPPNGREQIVTKRPPGRPPGKSRPPAVAAADSFIGQKVMTRWPQDNNFYEAIITDYNPENGTHALVYDINTIRETWEWVNLKEISPRDIVWDSDAPAGFGRGGAGCSIKKPVGRGGLVSHSGRGRGVLKGQPTKDSAPSQNGLGRKGPEDIALRQTEKLIKEVERLVGVGHPDPEDVEKAKRVLKEHEQSLLEAIERLAEASDEDDRHPPSSRTHSIDHERVRSNRQDGINEHASGDDYDTAEDGRGENSDGEHFVGEGGVASDDMQDGDEYG